ncbi:MAG: immunoglobulin-like domain-containing protein, partial [Bacteroidota bacterium]
FEIYGQRLDANGVEIGTNDFRISDMGPDGNSSFGAFALSVAFNAADNEYLVVWNGDDNSNGVVDNETEVFGQRLDAKGIEIGTNDFRISDMGPDGSISFNAIEPSVIYNSTDNEYLVVWQGRENFNGLPNNEIEIFGQLLDANRVEIGMNDFRISDMGPDRNIGFNALEPSVIHNTSENEYLVVWAGDDNSNGQVEDEFEIFGQLLDANGIEIGTNDFRISDMGPDGDIDFNAFAPSVSYDTIYKEYLVVWQGDDDSNGLVDDESEIFGQRLDAAGIETGANDFRISEMGPDGDSSFDALRPSLVYNATDRKHFAVWAGEDDTDSLVVNEFEIYGQISSFDPCEDDEIAPVPDIATLPDVTGECSVTVTAPTATDNCAGVITATTSNPLVYTSQGTFTITWTFDDGNGNTVTQNQTVIVDDVTAPMIGSLACRSDSSESRSVSNLQAMGSGLLPDITAECEAIVTAPTANDNCVGTITATTNDPLNYSNQGTFTITWTFDDGNGNIVTEEQLVIINDLTDPVPDVAALPDITGECAVSVTAPTATDSCSGSITATTTNPTIYSTQGTFTVTWTYDDGNGNTVTQNQTVIVDDVTAPTITLNGDASIIVDCDATSFTDPGAVASDNCDGATVQTTGSVDVTTPGTYTLNYQAVDVGGNTSATLTRIVVVPTAQQCSDCIDDLIITAADLAADPHASFFSADNTITIDGIITSDEQITLSAPNGIEFLGGQNGQFEVQSQGQLEVTLDACSDLLVAFRSRSGRK